MRSIYRTLGFTALLLVTLFSTTTAFASTWYVNSSTGDDTNPGTSGSPFKTFTQAYASSSANDTINLTGTIDLSSPDETGDSGSAGFTLSKNLTITGQNATSTIIQASSTDNTATERVFTLGSNTTITLSSTTIRYGNTSFGGCIQVGTGGALTLQYVDVFSCRSTGVGGAIYQSAGTTTISNSSLRNNVAATNGGALYEGTGGLIVTNSTLTGNQASTTVSNGGAAVYTSGSALTWLTNVTITNNNGYQGAFMQAAPGGRVWFKNSIIANNTAVSTTNVDLARSSGTITSTGYNIVGKYAVTYGTTTGDWTDPTGSGTYTKWGGGTGTLSLSSTALQNSIFGTYTHSLLFGSIGIDQGTTTASTTSNVTVSIPTSDQIGTTRQGTDPDIGAFEYVADTNPPTIAFSNQVPSNGTVRATSTFPVGLSTVTTSNSYAFVNLDHSLLGWWRFGNNSYDESGYGQTGVWSGTEAYTTGRFGQAGSFDGATSFDVQLQNAITSDFTVSAWVYLNSITDSAAIVSDANGHVIQIGGSDRWQFDNVYSAGSVATTGAWTHVVGVYEASSSTESLYVNGALVISGGGTRTIDPNINIGKRNDNVFINGKIDDVMILGRALSADEISSLYDASSTQYNHTFNGLSFGQHTFTGYVTNSFGLRGTTEERSVELRDPSISVTPVPTTVATPIIHGDVISAPTSTPVVVSAPKVVMSVIHPFAFTRDLKKGMTGQDVMELQKFLGVKSTTGFTTYFGSLTQAALIQYQKAHNIVPASGYFGPVTRRVVNK